MSRAKKRHRASVGEATPTPKTEGAQGEVSTEPLAEVYAIVPAAGIADAEVASSPPVAVAPLLESAARVEHTVVVVEHAPPLAAEPATAAREIVPVTTTPQARNALVVTTRAPEEPAAIAQIAVDLWLARLRLWQSVAYLTALNVRLGLEVAHDAFRASRV